MAFEPAAVMIRRVKIIESCELVTGRAMAFQTAAVMIRRSAGRASRRRAERTLGPASEFLATETNNSTEVLSPSQSESPESRAGAGGREITRRMIHDQNTSPATVRPNRPDHWHSAHHHHWQ